MAVRRAGERIVKSAPVYRAGERSIKEVPVCRAGERIIKGVPVLSQQHPKCAGETCPQIRGMDLMTFLRREQRMQLNHDERWRLFDRRSAECVPAGSIMRVTHLQSKSEGARPSSFTGILIAARRHVSEPTISLRAVVDGVGVEQLFPIFGPLVTKIEVVKRAVQTKSRKVYWLRDRPDKAAEFFAPAPSKESAE